MKSEKNSSNFNKDNKDCDLLNVPSNTNEKYDYDFKINSTKINNMNEDNCLSKEVKDSNKISEDDDDGFIPVKIKKKGNSTNLKFLN